jgi:hypothetical protein
VAPPQADPAERPEPTSGQFRAAAAGPPAPPAPDFRGQPDAPPDAGDPDRYRALRELGFPEQSGYPGPDPGDFGRAAGPPGGFHPPQPDQFPPPGRFSPPGQRAGDVQPGAFQPGAGPDDLGHIGEPGRYPGPPGGPYGAAAPPGQAYGRPAGPHGVPGGFADPDEAGGPPPAGPPTAVGGWQPPEQGRFETFRPEASAAPDAKDEAEPTPQVRNGRVLAAVITGAVLLLVLPFAVIWGFMAAWGNDPGFDVGSCVKQSGTRAEAADCGDVGAFEVVSKVANESECPDPNQPAAILPDNEGRDRVLCLKPAK